MLQIISLNEKTQNEKSSIIVELEEQLYLEQLWTLIASSSQESPMN